MQGMGGLCPHELGLAGTCFPDLDRGQPGPEGTRAPPLVQGKIFGLPAGKEGAVAFLSLGATGIVELDRI